MFIIIEVRILVYAGARCVGTWKERTCFLTLCSCSLVRDEHCHSTDQVWDNQVYEHWEWTGAGWCKEQEEHLF